MKKYLLPIALIGILGASTSHAATIVLDFEGAGELVNINDFYNGGTDSAGNSGTDYGIDFSADALAIIDRDSGGTGNFANEPSNDTVLFFSPPIPLR